MQRRDVIVGPEQARLGDELVQDHADGEQIGAPIEGVAAALLGRHVRDRAVHRAR